MNNLTAYQVEYNDKGLYKGVNFRGCLFCLTESEAMAEEIGSHIFTTKAHAVITMIQDGTLYEKLVMHQKRGFLIIDHLILFEEYLTRVEKVDKLLGMSE